MCIRIQMCLSFGANYSERQRETDKSRFRFSKKSRLADVTWLVWFELLTRLTESTAELAHSITSTHELQHGVKVAADWLKASSQGMHPPLFILVFLLCAISGRSWCWCCRVLGLLTERADDKKAQQEQKRSKKSPTGHLVSVYDHRQRAETEEKHTHSLRQYWKCLCDLDFEPEAGTISHVEEQSPASISSFWNVWAFIIFADWLEKEHAYLTCSSVYSRTF